MPSTNIRFCESEVVKLVEEFLENRGLNISLLNIERETGIINGAFSDDMLFLRQLILNGQWDDVIDFIQPLSSVESFAVKKFEYIVQKHKFLELLCLKGENSQMYEEMVERVVTTLHTLEQLCPTKEDYNNLCLLLTLTKLSDHVDYQTWNPSSGRVECFNAIKPLVEKFLAVDKRDKRNEDRFHTAKEDRLVQLLIKGMLYESCVDYCQHKATSNDVNVKDMKITHLLQGTGFSDADLSLLSWLQAIPHDIFTCPFEQKTLHVDMKPMDKPSLEASWSEQILQTPIKPKLFPHSAMPSRSQTDLMSRSLNPQYDGLAFGLNAGNRRDTLEPVNLMSRSFAGFHLNNSKRDLMHTSVEKLFESSTQLDTQSSIIIENTPPPKSRSPLPPGSPKVNLVSTPKLSASSPTRMDSPRHSADGTKSSQELYKEYQKQREQLREQLEEQEKKRQMYQEQLEYLDRQSTQLNQDDSYDNRFIDSGISPGFHKKSYEDIMQEKEGSEKSRPEKDKQQLIEQIIDENNTNTNKTNKPCNQQLQGVTKETFSNPPSPATRHKTYTNNKPAPQTAINSQETPTKTIKSKQNNQMPKPQESEQTPQSTRGKVESVSKMKTENGQASPSLQRIPSLKGSPKSMSVGGGDGQAVVNPDVGRVAQPPGSPAVRHGTPTRMHKVGETI